MGDILPPKRQTIVDRLRRRIELYCRNQSTCLPRSQQRTNGLSTQQTHQLKRGHLENQVKTSSPCQKSHPRLTKRSREFIEDLKDPSEPEKHRKNPRHKDVPFQGSLCSTQEEEKDIPSFSVQIVQQFTKVPHSQTIQTNVTVKAVPPTKRNSKSPLPSHLSSSENLSTLGNSPSCSSVGTNVNYKESNSSAVEDRLINSLPSFGFPEESNNDVIHPDVLKDLIDDVLTNESPSGLIKDIDFDDSVSSSENKRVKTNADVNGLTMNMGKDLNKTSPLQGHFPPPPNGHYTSPHSPISSSLFSPPVTTGFPSSMSSGFRLSLDFKLTEPSPAALTLKQMAEQHQSMQQKQQQQFGMDCGFPHSRYPFRRDGFQNTLASGRTTFLNGPTSNMNSLQNSHANDILSPGMSTFGARTNGGIFKEEGGSSGVYDVRPVTDLDVRIKESDLPLHKPPGLIQRCHVNGPDQRHVAPTSVSYGATRPLSHFTDPGVGRTASLSPQSSPYFQGQSPRVIQQYSSPVPRSPSAPSLQLSQSQQLRFSPGSQQLQVSQGQQLHITQDPKSASSTHNSQQQSTTYGNYPSSTLHSSGPFQMNLSQSQSVTLNTHYPPGGNSHSNINRLAVNHQQMTPQGAMSTPIHPQQSRVSQFPMRPSPHYKPHRIVSQPQHSPQIVMGNGSMMRYEHNMTPNFNHPDPTVTPTVGATAFHQLQNSSFLTQESQHPQIVGHRNASHSDPRFPQSVHQPNMPSSNNITHNQPSYNSALSRPPNVNAGPDGVNISHQQLPGTGVQWRNSFPQQEQSQLQVGVIGQSAAPWFPQQSPHMTPNIRPVAMDSVQKTVMSPHVQNLNTMMHHHQQGTRRMTPMDERNEVSVSGGDVISQSEPFRRKGHPQTGVMEEQPQFHLDFLDNIESSATDLLSFDQVMSTGNTNFDILEDMGIMGK